MTRTLVKPRFFFLFVVLCLPVLLHAQEPVQLEPGKSIEREIAGGQTHTYRITLAAGQFMRVLVEQTGCDVALTLVAPDGKIAVESKLNRPNDLESLSYEVPVSGEYQLQLRPFKLTDNYPNPGAYQVRLSSFTNDYRIRVETRATATVQDRQRIEAERLLAEAYRMGKQASATPQQKEEKAQQALALFRSLGDKYWEAMTLNLIATAHYAANSYDKGADAYTQALTVWRALGDQSNEARTLNDLGWAYQRAGNLAKAAEFFAQALKSSRTAKDRLAEAHALSNSAWCDGLQGRFEKAIEKLEPALSICREAKDRQYELLLAARVSNAYDELNRVEKADEFSLLGLMLARGLNDPVVEAQELARVGSRRYRQGQYDQAMEYFDQALRVSRASKDKLGEASVLTHTANILSITGQYGKAVACYEQALAIYQGLGNKNGEATILGNASNVYVLLSQFEKSLEYSERALALFRELRYRFAEGIALNNIGDVYLKLDRFEKARENIEQSLAIIREVGHKGIEAAILQTLGNVYRRQRQFEQARSNFEQSLSISRGNRDKQREALALQNFGQLYEDWGQSARAQEFLSQALVIMRQLKDKDAEGEALHQLMLANKSLAQPQIAVLYGKQAVNVWQAIRSDIRGLEQESQQTFFKSKEETYRLLADLLISQGRLPEAEQVIHLLKEEEFFEFIRRDQANATQQGQAQLTPEEQAIDKRYREIADKLTEIGTERSTLQEKKDRTPTKNNASPNSKPISWSRDKPSRNSSMDWRQRWARAPTPTRVPFNCANRKG